MAEEWKEAIKNEKKKKKHLSFDMETDKMTKICEAPQLQRPRPRHLPDGVMTPDSLLRLFKNARPVFFRGGAKTRKINPLSKVN